MFKQTDLKRFVKGGSTRREKERREGGDTCITFGGGFCSCGTVLD